MKGGKGIGGEVGNSMGLILDARSQLFFFFRQSLFTYTSSFLSLACLNRFSRLVNLIFSLGADFD